MPFARLQTHARIKLDDLRLEVGILSARKNHERIPIDPALRERAEKMFAHYREVAGQSSKTPPELGSDAESQYSTEALRDILASLWPKAIETLADLLNAADRSELSVTLQRKLIRQIEKTVEREGF